MRMGRGRPETRCEDPSYSVTCHSKPYVIVGETYQRSLLLYPSLFLLLRKLFHLFLFPVSISVSLSFANVMSNIRNVSVNLDRKVM